MEIKQRGCFVLYFYKNNLYETDKKINEEKLQWVTYRANQDNHSLPSSYCIKMK